MLEGGVGLIFRGICGNGDCGECGYWVCCRGGDVGETTVIGNGGDERGSTGERMNAHIKGICQ